MWPPGEAPQRTRKTAAGVSKLDATARAGSPAPYRLLPAQQVAVDAKEQGVDQPDTDDGRGEAFVQPPRLRAAAAPALSRPR